MTEDTRQQSTIPPHDLEAETSVLGAMLLLDQGAIAEVVDFLHPEDFYRENNGQVYQAALNLFRAGEPTDIVSLEAELERLGLLERVGGRAQLALLQESVPTAANVEHYARIVQEHAQRRRREVIDYGSWPRWAPTNLAPHDYDPDAVRLALEGREQWTDRHDVWFAWEKRRQAEAN